MKTMNRHLLALALVLLVLAIVACGPTATQAPPTVIPTETPKTLAPTSPKFTPTAQAMTKEGQPKRGGTVRVALHGPPKNIDPHKAPNQPEYWTAQQCYDYLLTLDKDLNIQPSLATDWEVSDDGLTWTFKLRKDVKFHNGRELQAADVKYSIERIMDEATASSQGAAFRSMVKSIEARNDYTVVFNMSAPSGVLLARLADPRSAIVAREIVEEKGDLSQTDAGSGPFEFVGMQPDGSVSLTRNPDYWQEGLPYLDGIVFIPISDASARVTALRTGDVDMIAYVVTNNISLLREEPNIVVPEQPISGEFMYFLMNPAVKPFDDVKVRQAIFYALDREVINQISTYGEGYTLLGGPLPSWHWAAIEPVYSKPDLERAKQLLAESSAPNGFECKMRIWAEESNVRCGQIVQEQLAPLNIKLNIEQFGDWSSFYEPIQRGEFEAYIQGFGGLADPDDWFYDQFYTGGGKNNAKYSNPEVDKLLDQARQVSDREERKELYGEVQNILAKEGPMAFLYSMKQCHAWRNYVEGFYHLPTLTFFALKETWLNK
jgi:peptide/nickel transport system substrate-binding protein